MQRHRLKQLPKRREDNVEVAEPIDSIVSNPKNFLPLLSTSGAVKLAEAYRRIRNPVYRQALVELAEQVASRQSVGQKAALHAGQKSVLLPLPANANRVVRKPATGTVGQRARRLRVTEMAKRTFGDDKFALQWLKLPNPALKNKVPFELAKTDPGAHEVEVILTRIAHGVYS